MTNFTQRLAAAAAALGLVSGAPAFAAAAPSTDALNRQDIVCIAVMGAAAEKAPDDKGKAFAGMGVLYYIGRIEGRSPGIDLRAVVSPQVRKLSIEEIQAAADGCVAELSARGQDLVAIGGDLQKQ